MTIPTEPIGSIPRPLGLIEAVSASGNDEDPELDALYEAAIRDTIERFEATGSPVISDGEQRKYHNFWTYSVQGLANIAPDGFKIPFAIGHTRRMHRQLVRVPRLLRPRPREAGDHQLLAGALIANHTLAGLAVSGDGHFVAGPARAAS